MHEAAQPKISVIIPVYNAAGFIRPSLDSLLAQTLQEIEIIPVDDCSTDDSFAILQDYAARYPGKVVPVLQRENGGPAAARWSGVQHARAPYIMFMDSDDFLDPRACELALAEALRGYDLVGLTNARRNQWGELSILQPPPRTLDNDTLIRQGIAAFWSYLYDKTLLEDESLYPPMYFEDAAVIPRVFARAKRIGYVQEPNMYHYVQREGSIMASFLTGRKQMDIFRADELLWAYAPEDCRAAFAERIARRLNGNHRKYPSLRVESVAHIQAMYPQLKPFLADCPPHVTEPLDEVMALPAVPPVPAVVYLDGFIGAQDPAPYRADLVNALFQPDFVFLDGSNCNLSAAPEAVRQALAEGNTTLAAAWFAMDRIREGGGFFLAPGTVLLPTAASLRYEKAFVCGDEHRRLSSHFFGGAAGDHWTQVMDALLGDTPLPGLRLNGAEEVSDAGVRALCAIHCFAPLPGAYCHQPDLPADRLRTVMALQLIRTEQTLEQERKEHDAACRKLTHYVTDLTRQRDELRAQRDHFRQSRDQLRQELEQLRASSLRSRVKGLLGKK